MATAPTFKAATQQLEARGLRTARHTATQHRYKAIPMAAVGTKPYKPHPG